MNTPEVSRYEREKLALIKQLIREILFALME